MKKLLLAIFILNLTACTAGFNAQGGSGGVGIGIGTGIRF